MLDAISLGPRYLGTKHFDIDEQNVKIVVGEVSSVCPNTDRPVPLDFLPKIESVYRRFGMVREGQAIHWVGDESKLENICRCNLSEVERPRLAEPFNDKPLVGHPPHDKEPRSRSGCTKEEANAIAMTLAKQDPDFVNKGYRVWAERISKAAGKGCSSSLARQTPLWIATMKRTHRSRRKGVRRPKVIQDGHEILDHLKREQMEDFETSPLEPGENPRVNKRL